MGGEMDELYVLQWEVAALFGALECVEVTLESGDVHGLRKELTRLTALWRDVLGPQEDGVVLPKVRQALAAVEPLLIANAIRRARLLGRLETVDQYLAGGGFVARTRLARLLKPILTELRAQLTVEQQDVLPRLYAACSDEDRWELARDLDRCVDQLGRARWEALLHDA